MFHTTIHLPNIDHIPMHQSINYCINCGTFVPKGEKFCQDCLLYEGKRKKLHEYERLSIITSLIDTKWNKKIELPNKKTLDIQHNTRRYNFKYGIV